MTVVNAEERGTELTQAIGFAVTHPVLAYPPSGPAGGYDFLDRLGAYRPTITIANARPDPQVVSVVVTLSASTVDESVPFEVVGPGVDPTSGRAGAVQRTITLEITAPPGLSTIDLLPPAGTEWRWHDGSPPFWVLGARVVDLPLEDLLASTDEGADR